MDAEEIHKIAMMSKDRLMVESMRAAGIKLIPAKDRDGEDMRTIFLVDETKDPKDHSNWVHASQLWNYKSIILSIYQALRENQ